ncbi:hypothetical protein OS175_00385 [Marinicella sp. S1101]|uniref:hypothetical protein n=1 Tax=Marinicella marina TaxID=2996016 RepID=UPI002260C74C|nr:hypothetical protein [Marinicella marina]MCX7552319.1 hypothetical protein [Marinicella marina]MDJ1139194.1 hypothetical protein [Marinicella marina]
MNNTNKIITIVIIAALIGLPYWRITHNSEFFAEGLLSHLNELGEWSHQSIDTSLNGEVVIKNLTFRPTGYQQTISIDAIEVHTDMKKLLFSGSSRLLSHIPTNLTMTFQNARVNPGNGDLKTAINRANYWPMAANYLGAFGCGEGVGPSFSDAQWQQILPQNPNFNLELSYSLVDDYHIDFNLNINSPSNWFIAWSGTLTRSSDVERISFNDTVIDTLYYYHADQGFNKKRNDVCAKANKESFAAYRLNSAEEIQKYLRVFAGQEMSSFLSNQYQRLLTEDIELNAIFDLREPRYIFEIAEMSQKNYYALIDIEAALGESEYQKIVLSEIDYINLDMETLRAEMQAKQEEADRLEAEANKPKELLKTITTTIGKSVNEVTVSDWSQAVGQNIKVRTKRGRPIFGKLSSINDKQLTIVSKYMRGNATITVMRDDVVSMSITR